MAFDYFGDFFEFGHDIFIHRAFFETHTDVGASAVSQCLGVYMVTRANDDFHVDHSLYALMYGGS